MVHATVCTSLNTDQREINVHISTEYRWRQFQRLNQGAILSKIIERFNLWMWNVSLWFQSWQFVPEHLKQNPGHLTAFCFSSLLSLLFSCHRASPLYTTRPVFISSPPSALHLLHLCQRWPPGWAQWTLLALMQLRFTGVYISTVAFSCRFKPF